MGNIFCGKKCAGPQIDTARTDFRQAVQNRVAPARENNLRLISELQATSQGQGPSFGTQALEKTTRRNLAQTLAAASAARGPSVAASKRSLMSQAGAGARNVAEQGAIIQAQEQQQAQNALSQLANSQQQQDLQQVMQPGEILAQAELARFQNAQDQAARDRAFAGQIGGALLGTAGAIGGAMAGGPAGAKIGQQSGEASGEAVGQMLSDKTQKKDVKSATKSVNSFLEALAAREFAYKNASAPGAAPGQRVGVMAQDLEKSKLGKSMVKSGPAGKSVDIAQALGASLAANAELHKRVKKLENKE